MEARRAEREIPFNEAAPEIFNERIVHYSQKSMELKSNLVTAWKLGYVVKDQQMSNGSEVLRSPYKITDDFYLQVVKMLRFVTWMNLQAIKEIMSNNGVMGSMRKTKAVAS